MATPAPGINIEVLKEAHKRVVAANRRVAGRQERIEAKRKDIEAYDKNVRDAKDRDAMNTAMKKLNRACAALDRIIETGHSHQAELAEALTKLGEVTSTERAKL